VLPLGSFSRIVNESDEGIKLELFYRADRCVTHSPYHCAQKLQEWRVVAREPLGKQKNDTCFSFRFWQLDAAAHARRQQVRQRYGCVHGVRSAASGVFFIPETKLKSRSNVVLQEHIIRCLSATGKMGRRHFTPPYTILGDHIEGEPCIPQRYSQSQHAQLCPRS
jgi:hypothetical protein